MDQILGQILRQAVWERLDMLDELASRADAESLLSVARTELPRLTEGWRALLSAHEPDARGRCPECSTRWSVRRAPCSVWRTAHASLVSAETASSASTSATSATSAAEPRTRTAPAQPRTGRAAAVSRPAAAVR